MRVLITRPLVDAQRTAEPLRARGVEPVIEPLFAISTIPAARVKLDGVQGFLVTSANGARALAETVPRDAPRAFDLPVYAVGETSAAAARERGFTQVLSADGDVEALVDLVRRRARPDAGTLVHAAGTDVAGDLSGSLEAAGYTVRRDRLYETRQAVALSRETTTLIANRAIHATFLFSPRTARIFAELARKAKVAEACGAMTAYCLSAAVADAAKALPFARVRVAEHPSQDALLSLFDADRAAGAYAGTDADADAEGGPEMTDRPKKDAKETEDKTTAKAAKAPEGTTAGAAAGGGSSRNGDKDTEKDKGKDKGKEKASGTDSRPSAPSGNEKRPPETKTDESRGAARPAAASVPPAGAAAATAATGGSGGRPPSASGEGDSGDGKAGPARSGAAAPRKQARPARTAAIVAGVVIVVAAVAYGSMPYWRENIPQAYQGFLPPYPEADARLAEVQSQNEQLLQRIQTLQERVAALDSQLVTLNSRLTQVAAEAESGPELPPDLAERLTQMESQLQVLAGLDPQALESVAAAGEGARQEIAALREELAEVRRGTADASTVLAMQERLDRVAEMARQQASRRDTALALVLTTAQLRQAVDQGNPFDSELRTVRAVADEMPNVTLEPGVLTDYADTGIPTREMLAERFEGLASEIITAAAAPDDAPAWVQKTVQRAMSLVTVRRTDGEAVGDDAAAVVARTASALEAGNLADAVSELQRLEGEAAAVAQPWIADARARLAAEAVVSDMTAEALARFGATPPEAAGSGAGAGSAAETATGTEG